MNESATLFARPSAIEGAARLLDLGGTLQGYNNSQSDMEADSRALSSDWYAIGQDLGDAVGAYVLEDILAQIRSLNPSEDELTIKAGNLSLEYSQGEVRVWRQRVDEGQHEITCVVTAEGEGSR